jgi:prepilin-type N-terminal cleavage/methylation domain-containing protein
MTPRFLDNDTYLLTNERGVTLLEVLVSALVLAVLVISIYIGIQYAEKQSVLNNRQRAATLLATGELDRQYFYNKYNANQNDLEFMPYGNQEVTIDVLESGAQLTGLQSVSTRRASEFSGAQQYPYTEVITRVEWIDPASGETQYIEMREDYYVRAGN